MGTRGAYGFRLNGQDKLSYNHFDSYPEGLGRDIVNALRTVSDFEALKERVMAIKMVEEEAVPTPAEIAENAPCVDATNMAGYGWYSVLRGLQGNLSPWLDGTLHVMTDCHNFMLDSVFCEWAYIVNLDTQKLEVWQGWQKQPQEGNRYGTEADDGYFPCALVKEFPLAAIPEDWQAQVEQATAA